MAKLYRCLNCGDAVSGRAFYCDGCSGYVCTNCVVSQDGAEYTCPNCGSSVQQMVVQS